VRRATLPGSKRSAGERMQEITITMVPDLIRIGDAVPNRQGWPPPGPLWRRGGLSVLTITDVRKFRAYVIQDGPYINRAHLPLEHPETARSARVSYIYVCQNYDYLRTHYLTDQRL
jgi:hypothetical protein